MAINGSINGVDGATVTLFCLFHESIPSVNNVLFFDNGRLTSVTSVKPSQYFAAFAASMIVELQYHPYNYNRIVTDSTSIPWSIYDIKLLYWHCNFIKQDHYNTCISRLSFQPSTLHLSNRITAEHPFFGSVCKPFVRLQQIDCLAPMGSFVSFPRTRRRIASLGIKPEVSSVSDTNPKLYQLSYRRLCAILIQGDKWEIRPKQLRLTEIKDIFCIKKN